MAQHTNCQGRLVPRGAGAVISDESLSYSGCNSSVVAGCLIRVSDAVIQYISPESVFYFSLRHTDSEKCDIILVSSSYDN